MLVFRGGGGVDFTGLNKFNAYKVGRAISYDEMSVELDKYSSVSEEIVDWISVIKINDTYLEVVDRWYARKGFSTWLGMLFFVPFLVTIFAFLWLMIEKNSLSMWLGGALVIAIFSLCVWVAAWGISMDAFRQTHYPIRLNRKTRDVYAFRPNGTIIQAKWEDLFIFEVKNQLTMGQVSYDIRVHVLGEDRKTIEDTFTLAYPDHGDRESLLMLWEYIRRYMANDNVEGCYKVTKICPPIDGRKEGFIFGVVRVFATTANHLFVQMLISPMAALEVLGRWFAMCTCKVPRWPEEIEAACPVDPDDPYQKDWRDNGKYDFRELGWPLICFFVGLGVLGVGLTFLVRELLA
ncbi:DUF6708 domain-containing protein [Halomonas sp. V046]|uniref:DUF6708 domain-containing protein n=1 Tax=Halomonas sp. V046 TaxID=3459611 RepID=UPI004043E693